eukprot:10804411-Alexandrium_andersonii.AAC.1
MKPEAPNPLPLWLRRARHELRTDKVDTSSSLASFLSEEVLVQNGYCPDSIPDAQVELLRDV